MKTLVILLAAVLLTVNVLAQAPQKMSYQAVIRNSSNILVTNAQVTMRISILRGITPVYVERQTATSNTNGLVTLEIGNGLVLSGSFAAIDWAAGAHFIKTETDPTGGTNYSIFGTSELLSVPYALYAENGGGGGASIDITGKEDKSNKVTVLSNNSTDVQFPSAKLVYDQLALKQNKLVNPVIRSDSITIYVTPYQLSQFNTKSFEIEISVNGIKNIELPFSLKPTAMVWCNGFILKNNQWFGIGTFSITLYIDSKIHDLIKIQN